jgi:hypothetical protein
MSDPLVQNQYINTFQFQDILSDLSVQLNTFKQQELLNRATGELERDLSKKFVVPLVFSSVGFEVASTVTIPYSTPPAQYTFAVNVVLTTLKEKIREIVGYDKNRNLVGTIESTQKFLNIHGEQYSKMMKALVEDYEIDYGFQLQAWTVDAKTPIQHLALARGDDKTRVDEVDWNEGRDYFP